MITHKDDVFYCDCGFSWLRGKSGRHDCEEGLRKRIAELEARCAALAAENAALKESRNNLAEFVHEELDADYPLNMDIEAPATDTFLAEVRAHGVEMLAEHARNECSRFDLISDRDGYAKWDEIFNVCSDFAAQLSKEAAQ